MTDFRPAPPVPDYADLSHFKDFPLDLVRFKGSAFVSKATPEGLLAAMRTWTTSWHQRPAGSLPKDEDFIMKACGYNRNPRGWARVREAALNGWFECQDGRLYHPVVAEKVNEALGRSKKAKKAAKARWDEDTEEGQKEGQNGVDRPNIGQSSPDHRANIGQSSGDHQPNVEGPSRTHIYISDGNSSKPENPSNPPVSAIDGKEGKDGRKNTSSNRPTLFDAQPSAPPPEGDRFVRWYRAYPRHVAKSDANRAFDKLMKAGKAPFESLMAATEAFAAAMVGKDPQYIPHPATWLNKERFLEFVPNAEGGDAGGQADEDPNQDARRQANAVRLYFAAPIFNEDESKILGWTKKPRRLWRWSMVGMGGPPGADDCRIPRALIDTIADELNLTPAEWPRATAQEPN